MSRSCTFWLWIYLVDGDRLGDVNYYNHPIENIWPNILDSVAKHIYILPLPVAKKVKVLAYFDCGYVDCDRYSTHYYSNQPESNTSAFDRHMYIRSWPTVMVIGQEQMDLLMFYPFTIKRNFYCLIFWTFIERWLPSESNPTIRTK